MTTGARAKLVARCRTASGLDVVQVHRAERGTSVFLTTDGQVGWWRPATGECGLFDQAALQQA